MKRIILMSSILMSMASAMASQPALTYPKTATVDVKDTYFGTEVADPYRWLENDTTAETAAWVASQNEVTNKYLSQIPFRGAIKDRLTELANYEKIGSPFKKNGKYYFFKNDGLQNQSVLFECATLDGEPRELLDPNKLSTDGTVALQGISFSKDGKYMAYTISRSGSDWNEIYVIEVATRKQLDDVVKWSKFSIPAWHGDGFFYSTYDVKEGAEYSAKNEYHKVYYHKLGTLQSSDRLDYQNKKEPLRFYSVDVSDDSKYVFLYESDGGGVNLHARKVDAKNSGYKQITNDIRKRYYIVGNVGSTLYVRTNDDAPMYRVVAIDLNNPAKKNWKTTIPESTNVLASVSLAADKMILTYDVDASNRIYVHSLEGKQLKEIALPTLGSVDVSCDQGESEMFYTFTSFTTPATVYGYNIESGESTIFKTPTMKFNPADYVTEQVEYPSKDGTIVRMFITYKKGLKRDGNNPVYLYGYGGFNVTLNPSYNPFRMFVVENGGIYAMVNLRGGGEYGEKWHEAGTKMKKQNVFDDFICAAEYLIKEKYTSPAKIAINGGSNGGLLVGAVANQRPDLFAVAIPQVGVMDMLRYHTFTIGWNWARDYGRSDDSREMFEYLRGYSPLHTIKNDGTRYPAIMVTTADHDDRVVPAHSFKYAATLQASNTGDAPKLIRIDSKAGHGAGKPITKVIDEYTDIMSFVFYHLGLEYKK